MKFNAIALVALSVVADAKNVRGMTSERRLASCLGDFTTVHTGPCTVDAIKGVVDSLVIADTSGTCGTVDAELAELLGNPASVDEALAALCEAAEAEQVAGFKPFQDISKLGDTHDREFLNGGTFWNEQVETADGEYVLSSDLSRILMIQDTEAQANGIGWPTSAAISSVHECAVDAAMCCYVSDRQSGDSGGTCTGPGCFFAEPTDNTDICYVDMSNAPAVARVANGVAIFDKKDAVSDSEGGAYCHGFAWNDADASGKYKGNLLFEVAMYQNLYDKGYVQNVPGAPMCGCIEKMPVVSNAACTDLTANESWTISATAGANLTVGIESVTITYGDCGGEDLATHFKTVNAGSDIDSFVVGDGNCHSAVDDFAATNLGLVRSTLEIAEVLGHPSQDGLSIVFSKEVADEALDLANYEIPGLTINEARFGNDFTTVILSTSEQTYGTDYVVTIKGTIAKRIAPMVTVPLDTTATLVVTTYGYESNVPEASDYTLLYNLDIPTIPNWNSPNFPAYTYGDTPFIDYTRVAYWMELESEEFGHEWVWVSMPPYVSDYRKLGIPVFASKYFYNGLQDGANVYTNQKDIAEGGSLTDVQVNLEFWPNNYGTKDVKGVGATGNKYDFGDERVTSGSYGSFQVHVPSEQTTLFALNHWGSFKNAPVDLGIGNQATGQPDWTFNHNGGIYTLKNLAVLVKAAPLAAADLGPPNKAADLADAQGYDKIFSLDIPSNPNFKNPVPYSLDLSIFHPNGSFKRVAYYMELDSEWIWVSMDTFTDDAKKLGVPTFQSKAVFQEQVTGMNVYSNIDGMEAHNITGGVEFWPYNYGPADALNMGASDKYFDYGDTMSTGGDHGSMQVHGHALGHGTNLFSMNGWNRGRIAELGIGNNENGEPDWTFVQNAASFTVKKLEVFIK